MKTLTMIPLLWGVVLFHGQAMAHNGADPIAELNKRDRAITRAQSEFASSQSNEAKLEFLTAQVNALSHKIMTLRNLMASDYPHVKENMSKYKLDYIESVDKSLVQTRALLRQLEQVVDQ